MQNNNWIYNLDKSNQKAFFSKLELEKIEENIINIDDNFSYKEIEDIIVKWISIWDKENRYADDIPSSTPIIQWKKLVINNDEIFEFSRNFIGNNKISTLTNIIFTEWIYFPSSWLSMCNCTVEGDIMFASFKNWDINLQSTNVKWSITWDSEYAEWMIDYWALWKIYLHDCEIDSVLEISHFELYEISIVNTEVKWISISHTKIQSLHIEWSNIYDLSLIDCNPREEKWDFSIDLRLTWNGSIVNNINLTSCKNISNVKIIEDRMKEQEYPFINFRIDNIIFDEDVDLYLSWTKLWDFIINDVAILWKKFKLNNLLINNNFIINDVNFGSTIFNGLSFSDQCNKFIKLPVFNNCTFNDIDWSNFDFQLENEKEKLKNTLREQRDIYRQLKYVLDSNWNKLDANKFYEKEMQYEMKRNLEEVIFKDWFRKWIKELWQNDFLWKQGKILWERIVLLLWYNINEFWNNWLSPIKLILSLAIIATSLDFSYYDYIAAKNDNTTGLLFSQNIETIIQNSIIILLIIFFTIKYFTQFIIFLIFITIIYTNGEVIKIFFQYLYPLYWLKQDFIKSLNAFELWSFILYKVIYWILLWHLIVALKRTTRR